MEVRRGARVGFSVFSASFKSCLIPSANPSGAEFQIIACSFDQRSEANR